MRSLLELRKRNLIQNNEYLQFMMGEAQEQGDFKPTQYAEAVVKNNEIRYRIDKALGKYTSHSVIVH